MIQFSEAEYAAAQAARDQATRDEDMRPTPDSIADCLADDARLARLAASRVRHES
jgi:hypothetical protein